MTELAAVRTGYLPEAGGALWKRPPVSGAGVLFPGNRYLLSGVIWMFR